jgi:hypothetical protein
MRSRRDTGSTPFARSSRQQVAGRPPRLLRRRSRHRRTVEDDPPTNTLAGVRHVGLADADPAVAPPWGPPPHPAARPKIVFEKSVVDGMAG